MEHRFENNHEEADKNQHLDWRERPLTMAADVVAHQIARAQHQLDKRIGERAGVESPKERYVILDGLPPHASQLSLLAAARTEVVGKLSAAVVTMLRAALMAIDIMPRFLLPTGETVVILYELLFVHKPQR